MASSDTDQIRFYFPQRTGKNNLIKFSQIRFGPLFIFFAFLFFNCDLSVNPDSLEQQTDLELIYIRSEAAKHRNPQVQANNERKAQRVFFFFSAFYLSGKISTKVLFTITGLAGLLVCFVGHRFFKCGQSFWRSSVSCGGGAHVIPVTSVSRSVSPSEPRTAEV